MSPCPRHSDVCGRMSVATGMTPGWPAARPPLLGPTLGQAVDNDLALPFYRRPGASLSGTLLAQTACRGAKPIRVRTIPLQTVIADVGGRVDLLKVDAEGAEYDILAGCPHTALVGVHRIVSEYHPVPGCQVAALIERLTARGFCLRLHEKTGRSGRGLLWFERAG